MSLASLASLYNADQIHSRKKAMERGHYRFLVVFCTTWEGTEGFPLFTVAIVVLGADDEGAGGGILTHKYSMLPTWTSTFNS